MSDQIPLQYRINIFDLSGRLLISTEFTDDRDKVIFLTDTINRKTKDFFRASPETRGTGYVHLPCPQRII
jgi:hypothetical protein